MVRRCVQPATVGPLTKQQALAAGWTPWQLRRGAIGRSVRDTYLPAGDSTDLLTRARVVMLTMAQSALLSHTSAAELCGIELPSSALSSRVHLVALRDERPRQRSDRVVHESVRLHPVDGSVVAYPRLRIAIEFDGAGHRAADVFAKDLRRQNRLVNDGWTVLRFSGTDVLGRPDYVVAQVRAAWEKAFLVSLAARQNR